ncbi:MAG: hypothetical protein WC876_05570 [Candidatus Thermoplasmatota archaeon]
MPFLLHDVPTPSDGDADHIGQVATQVAPPTTPTAECDATSLGEPSGLFERDSPQP